MTEPTMQDLRDWSAENVMGWADWGSFYTFPDTPSEIVYTKEDISFGPAWRPDDPTTGQIWMFVDRMRELGYLFDLTYYTIYGVILDYWTASFYDGNSVKKSWGKDTNPCHAILLAGYEALKGDKSC